TEQERRLARQETRSGRRRSCVRLATVRRKSVAVAREGQSSGRVRMLDLGLEKISTACFRERQWVAVLPGSIRGRGILQECDLYRCSAEPTGDSRCGLPDEGSGRETLDPGGNGLRLSPDDQQDPRSLLAAERCEGGRHFDQLYALRFFRLAGACGSD